LVRLDLLVRCVERPLVLGVVRLLLGQLLLEVLDLVGELGLLCRGVVKCLGQLLLEIANLLLLTAALVSQR